MSLVLGLAVLLGVVSLYLANRDLFRSHEGLARVQESGRFAFDRLLREVRHAGHIPCGTRLDANTLRTVDSPAMDWWADTDGGLVRAFDATQHSVGIVDWGTGLGERLPGTGALLLLRPSDDPGLLRRILAHAPADRRFTLDAVGDLRAGDIVLACDGLRSALFQASGVDLQAGTLDHAATGRNCTDRLGGIGAGCLNPVGAQFLPELGALLARWDPSFWYVGANSQGTRSLYRLGLNAGGGSGPVPGRQEMVRGVQDLLPEVLTRDDLDGGLLAATWEAPSGVPAWNLDTRRVVALRITLTLRAEDGTGASGEAIERRMVAVATLRNRDR